MCLTTKYLSNDIANITKDIRSNYSYVEDHPWLNKSNRLKKVERYNTKYFDLAAEYSFDPDGNFTSLTRSYNSDNFFYDYYSGTNRLKKVTGLTDQYTYDYNGNQTNDYLNNNTGIKYDHRNLITEFTRQDLNQDPSVTDITRYKYDEAGNRIRKTIYRSNDSNPPPLPEETEDLPSGWSITKDEYYSRDASGKEIAVYQSYTLDYWNVWGTGNEGRIKSTGMKYFYLKDHLGSIRAVINQNNVLVQAQDYDPWGHIARTWDSASADYKFTGKERDAESNYDYFGARFYDSRTANWGTVDPKMEKSCDFSPFHYALRNPCLYLDLKGEEWYYIWNDGGKSGDWTYYKNTPTMDLWNGQYDANGNKITMKQQGLIELLGFNGSKLTWYNEDGSIRSWNAVSGVLKDGKIQPDKQNISKEGPIPIGWWSVDPKNTLNYYAEQNVIQKLIWEFEYGSWGFYKTPIKPIGENLEIKRNSGFSIHGGVVPGSAGCIDLTYENDNFHEAFLQHNKEMILHVDYSKLK